MKFFWLRALPGWLAIPTLGLAAPARTPAITEGRTAYASAGKEIRVETFLPPGQERHPAVIVLYGSGGSLSGKKDMVKISRRLAGEGMSVFLIHYFHRTGTLYANDARITRWWRTWRDTVRDGVTYVSQHPRVNPSSIGVYGYSLGAYLAVAEAGRNPQIDAVVELSGGLFDEVRNRLTRLPPTLILHGRLDERVPVSRAHDLERTAGHLGLKPEVHIYEKEAHVLSDVAMADADARAIQFLKKHLQLRASTRP